MNDRPESLLDRLVHEASQHLAPRVSDAAWEEMENRLLSRMERDAGGTHSLLSLEVSTSRSRKRAFQVMAATLAAAAAVLWLIPRELPRHVSPDSPKGGDVADLAGSLLDSTGDIRVSGAAVTSGHKLRAGDVVEVEQARAILERPGKVRWLLERDEAHPQPARFRVKSAGETLIVGLEAGAIEAQVTPVPSGEAFAVDIASDKALVRVAVHGTHFRVSRRGTRVVVDLTEGVVSIGVPPRTGSTYGTLVTAPSHVEFDAASLTSSLKVEHDPALVRAPVPLLVQREGAALSPVPGALPPANPLTSLPPSVTPHARAERAHAPSLPARAENNDPREAVSTAVRQCVLAQHRSAGVRVTVSSSLHLKVAAGGQIESARFDPPLLPEVQACAAAAIYKVTMAPSAGTSVTIPIEFTYGSE